jgi:hypothetical protein
MGRKPVIPNLGGSIPVPIINKAPAGLWTFSFQHFKQIDNFGLSNIDSKWFISLIDRMRDLSKLTKEEFIRQARFKDSFRYHTIDWNAKNIPINKADLDWIPTNILTNNEEYPFYQFHVSQALGRIVGYWNSNVFNVVLLDPMHNLQPSQYNDYKIKESYPVDCKYTSLLLDVEKLKSAKCDNPECGYQMSLMALPSQDENRNIVMAHLDDEYYTSYKDLVEKKNISFTQLIEGGIMYHLS